MVRRAVSNYSRIMILGCVEGGLGVGALLPERRMLGRSHLNSAMTDESSKERHSTCKGPETATNLLQAL